MITPFQRLLYCSARGARKADFILAASGPTIRSFNIEDGSLVFSWSHLAPSASKKATSKEHANGEDSNEPPEKRRKLSSDEVESETPSTEIVVEGQSQRRRRPKRKAPLVPSIISLCSTSDGNHVVAVTGEDKCLRVLELLHDGRLNQLSQRVMPKRPSAVTLTTDQKTILSADKFGDVYALPLVDSGSNLDTGSSPPESIDKTPKRDESVPLSEDSSARFIPSASSSTVHMKRNLKALQDQQRVVQNEPKKKATIDFEHQLVLGHVSMLTDIAFTTVYHASLVKSFIFTADRDEHIRMSRGMPQAHIIEGYLLGHEQFVSRMHIPPWESEILVSGGGDDYLLVWHWETASILQRVDIRSHIQMIDDTADGTTTPAKAQGPIAVSGIYSLQTSDDTGHLIVSFEGVPALIIYSMDEDQQLSYQDTLMLEGNVLDVAVCHERNSLLYCVDNVHQPWTTKTLKPERGRVFVGAYQYDVQRGEWEKSPEYRGLASINQIAATEQLGLDLDQEPSNLSDLFYGIEHLRKRHNEDGDDGAAAGE